MHTKLSHWGYRIYVGKDGANAIKTRDKARNNLCGYARFAAKTFGDYEARRAYKRRSI